MYFSIKTEPAKQDGVTMRVDLTYCGLVIPYDDMDLDKQLLN